MKLPDIIYNWFIYISYDLQQFESFKKLLEFKTKWKFHKIKGHYRYIRTQIGKITETNDLHHYKESSLFSNTFPQFFPIPTYYILQSTSSTLPCFPIELSHLVYKNISISICSTFILILWLGFYLHTSFYLCGKSGTIQTTNKFFSDVPLSYF